MTEMLVIQGPMECNVLYFLKLFCSVYLRTRAVGILWWEDFIPTADWEIEVNFPKGPSRIVI